MKGVAVAALACALVGASSEPSFGPGPGKPFTPPPVRTGKREKERRAQQEARRAAKSAQQSGASS